MRGAADPLAQYRYCSVPLAEESHAPAENANKLIILVSVDFAAKVGCNRRMPFGSFAKVRSALIRRS